MTHRTESSPKNVGLAYRSSRRSKTSRRCAERRERKSPDVTDSSGPIPIHAVRGAHGIAFAFLGFVHALAFQPLRSSAVVDRESLIALVFAAFVNAAAARRAVGCACAQAANCPPAAATCFVCTLFAARCTNNQPRNRVPRTHKTTSRVSVQSVFAPIDLANLFRSRVGAPMLNSRITVCLGFSACSAFVFAFGAAANPPSRKAAQRLRHRCPTR